MPRKPVSNKELAEIFTDSHKYGGIAELQSSLTEEEESRETSNTFRNIATLGYEHIHTLKVVPSDGREPYYVHMDK